MHAFLDTAGERLAIDCSAEWVAELISEGSGGELLRSDAGAPTVYVRVEQDRHSFQTGGWEPVTRHAWRRDGEVVLENACTSGFDLRLTTAPERVDFTFRWRPPARERVAARVLRGRFHLLTRAVLLQYPALWWAGSRGRAPLHASACATGGSVPLLIGAGGIGRSTLVLRELESGGRATGDNLAVGDGTTVWGLVEPLRVEGGSGRRMPHGRREVTMPGRIEALDPHSLVVLERGRSERPSLSPCTAESAARALVTSTYMAEELRRFWGFAATLSRGTGIGPAHPPIQSVASAFAARLPSFVLDLGSRPGARLSELLEAMEVAA